MYKKIPKDKLFRNANLIWNNTLADHISNEIHGGTYAYQHDDLLILPPVIMHLHFLWRAQCELGASGFAYLFQAKAKEIIGIYNALNEIEAWELSKLMGEAIAMANQYETIEYAFEIKETPLQDWFDKFTETGAFKDLEDRALMQKAALLSTGYLNQKILQYINQNLDVICK
jgi:hypothetical protein